MSVLSDLLNVLKQDAAKDILPIIADDLKAIAANPDLVLNPLSQVIEFAKLQNDLLGAVAPSGQFAKDVVTDVANFLVGYIPVKVALAQKLKG